MVTKRFLGFSVVLSAAVISPPTLAVDTYTCKTVDVPGATNSQLWRLNNKAQIAASAAAGSFIYQSATGNWVQLPAPLASTGFNASAVFAEDINASGTIIGTASNSRIAGQGFILKSLTGAYDFVPPYLDSTKTNTYEEFNGVGDNGLVTGDAVDVNGFQTGLIYNPTRSKIGSFEPGYTPIIPALSNGAESNSTVVAGMNSAGSFVGSAIYESDTGFLQEGFVFDAANATYHVLVSATLSSNFRGVNDKDPNSNANCSSADCIRLVGWGTATGPNAVGFFADFDPSTGLQTPHIVGCEGTVPSNSIVNFEGINDDDVIVGFYSDASGRTFHGLVAYPNVRLPSKIIDKAFVFNFPVLGNTAVFLDPAIASGYVYATGANNPAFQSVTLPIGIGKNNLYSLIVDGYGFSLPAGKRFDFTKSGFASGVDSFTVIGIDSGADISTTNTAAFVTEVSFVDSGDFSGSMTPLTTVTERENGGTTSCADIDAIKAAFGKKTGQPGFNPKADTNGDGVINDLDLKLASSLLPAGISCK